MSSEFPVSAFGLSLGLFYSPPINITNDLAVWQQKYYQTLWHPKSRPEKSWRLSADVFCSPWFLPELFFDWRYCLSTPREAKVLSVRLLKRADDVADCCLLCLLPIFHSYHWGSPLTYQDVSVVLFQASKQHGTVWEYQTGKGLEAPSWAVSFIVLATEPPSACFLQIAALQLFPPV